MDKAEYDGNMECQRMGANIGVIQAGKMVCIVYCV
jgi:hypothetical protein